MPSPGLRVTLKPLAPDVRQRAVTILSSGVRLSPSNAGGVASYLKE